MPAGRTALIWAKLLPLGLTKRLIRRRLRLNNYQMAHVWTFPGEVLTIRQLQDLHAMVATYYTMPEIAQMVANDGFKPSSPMNLVIKDVCNILMSNEGQKHWDSFMATKRGGKTGKYLKTKKEKAKVSREVFTRISDELATDEVLTEFSIEHQRLKELRERTESKGSDLLPGDVGPIVSI